MPALRYIDLVVVAIAAVPALALGAPTLGYLVGAGAWILQRALQLNEYRLDGRYRGSAPGGRLPAVRVVRPGLATGGRDHRRRRGRLQGRRSDRGAGDLRRLLDRVRGEARKRRSSQPDRAMSAVAEAPKVAPKSGGEQPSKSNGEQPAKSDGKQPMSPLRKGLYIVGAIWLGGIIFFVAVFGLTAHKSPTVASGVFTPTDEFKLDTWFSVGPVDFNKGVLYLLLAAGSRSGSWCTCPGGCSSGRGACRRRSSCSTRSSEIMSRGNLAEEMKRKYFPLIATLFVFILVSNLIGYIPLPVNSGEKFNIFGARTFRRSRSTRPTPTSPSRWSSRSASSSCSTTRASRPITARSATSRA